MRFTSGALILIVAGALTLAYVWWGRETPPAEKPPSDHPKAATERSGDKSAVVFPKGFKPSHPPGSRTPMQVQPVETGIPVGDGSFLPPLNGVRVEDGIPPIRRDRRLPAPGPVVAKVVDQNGQEWWIHADGSQTSCSYASITTASGEDKIIVSTQHGAARPGGHGVLGK